jgi:hypothetical protein
MHDCRKKDNLWPGRLLGGSVLRRHCPLKHENQISQGIQSPLIMDGERMMEEGKKMMK